MFEGLLSLLASLFTDYTVRNVALGSAVLGVAGGVLGTFAVLRRQGLLGDALAHATLPGVAVAFILSGARVPAVLLAGAAVSAALGALAISAIVANTRVKYDAALGIILSVFFGAGAVLITYVAGSGDAAQSGLDRFIFGQASAIVAGDVLTTGLLALAALVIVGALFKELKLLSFDPEFAAGIGLPVRGLDLLLTSLMVVAVIIGIQAVGVVLMAAMLITPAAAARQWTDRLGAMAIISGAFGAASGVAGALFSATGEGLPTGPLIVLCATAILLVSLAFGSRRGILWSRLRARRNRRNHREALAGAGEGA